MARTGEQENRDANKQLQAQQAEAYAKSNAAVDKYNQDLASIKSGNMIVANPWTNPGYLENANRLAATGSHATTNAAKATLEDTALRTGNNTASTVAAIRNTARQANQDVQTRQTAQAADDYNKWIDLNMNTLNQDLSPTGATGNLYSTATGGRSQALGNLTQLGMASYGPINAAIGAAGAAAGGYFSGKKSNGSNG